MKKVTAISIFFLLLIVSWIPTISSDEKIFEDKNLDSSLIFTPSLQEIHKLSLNENIKHQTLHMIEESKEIGNQTQPAISSNQNNSHFLAYKDDAIGEIIWGTIDGDIASYDLEGGFYPSIKHRNDTSFFGTFVPDNSYHNGSAIFLMQTTNSTDLSSWSLGSWYWDSQGWYNITDSEIACGSSDESWNWGYISFVSSSTYSGGFTNSPQVSYQTDEDGAMTLSWSPIEYCNHTDADIDANTKKAYSIYDRFYDSSWQLFLMINDFNDNMSFVSSYDIVGTNNLTCPKIAVNNDNMVIVAETNQNGNKDIICIYGTPNNPQQTMITNEGVDESFPEIEYISDTTYICSYISNNQLYISISPTGGNTWSNPIKIKDNVIESYKSTDLSENLDYLGYEIINDTNIDIMFDDNRLSLVFVDDDFSSSTPGWQYDHFDDIQDGIDAVSENGTVYVYNGTYYENIIVNKTIELIGQDRNNTIIDGDVADFVVYITENCVNISYFTIKNSGTHFNHAGIAIGNVNNTSITSNNIINNFNGINFYSSNYNHIIGNNISNNEFGIILTFSSDNNNITGNNLLNNRLGIDIWSSNNSILSNNYFLNNGIIIEGIKKENWNTHCIDITNTVNEKPIYYWKNQTDGTIPTNAGQIILANCTGVTVENQNINGVSAGIQLGFSDSNNISYNNVSNNTFVGIFLISSYYNNLTGNNVSNNDYGFYLYLSNNNNIKDNIVSSNTDDGLSIEVSSYNYIMGNIVKSNMDFGISIYYSSDNNLIYNNYFDNIDNYKVNGNNIWNISKSPGTNIIGGPYFGGNYWSDYNGSDNDGDKTFRTQKTQST